MAIIIDGKITSQKVKDEVFSEVKKLTEKGMRKPCLAVVLVGDNEASKIYVRNKKRSCEEVGFISLEYLLPADTNQEELNTLIDSLNSDDTVDGILVQLPLPEGLDE